jgi:hypothetical protein
MVTALVITPLSTHQQRTVHAHVKKRSWEVTVLDSCRVSSAAFSDDVTTQVDRAVENCAVISNV